MRQLLEQITVAVWGRILYSDFQLEQVSIIPYQVEVNTVQLKKPVLSKDIEQRDVWRFGGLYQ